MKKTILLTVSLFLFSCGEKHEPQQNSDLYVTFKFKSSGNKVNLNSSQLINHCIFVNVHSTEFSQLFPSSTSFNGGTDVSELRRVSGLIGPPSAGSSTTVSLSVPKGSNRVVQVWGLRDDFGTTTQSSTSCSQLNLTTLNQPQYSIAKFLETSALTFDSDQLTISASQFNTP